MAQQYHAAVASSWPVFAWSGLEAQSRCWSVKWQRLDYFTPAMLQRYRLGSGEDWGRIPSFNCFHLSSALIENEIDLSECVLTTGRNNVKHFNYTGSKTK